MKRYGMAHRTIRYFQEQARDLYRHNGIYSGRGTLENAERHTAQQLGHAIIGLAAVASPEHLRAVLNGTRGRRWIV